MAKPRSKTLAQKFQEKENTRVTDYDPEAPNAPSDNDDDASNGSGSDGDDVEYDGTEHYTAVGQSKLRKCAALTTLGPRYQGSRVSRAALDTQDQNFDDDDDEDKEEESFVTAREDESVSDSGDDSEQVPARSFTNPKHKKRPVAADYITAERDGKVKRGTKSKGPSGVVGQEEGDDDAMVEAGDDSQNEEDTVMETGDESQDENDDSDESMDELGREKMGADEEEGEDEDEGEDDSDEDSLGEDDDDVFGLNGGEDDSEDEDDDEDDEDGGAPLSKRSTNTSQASTVANDRQAILSALSQTAQKEAEKGMAIRHQRATFDGLLNIRIRLQKALVAANTFHVTEEPSSSPSTPADNDSYKAAEDAALKLWDALGDLRSRYDGNTASTVLHAGSKRKRESDDPKELWDDMQAYQERRAEFRDHTLERWSTKMRSNENVTAGRNKPLRPLVTALKGQLLGPSGRLVKRSRVPRSCAPTQFVRKIAEDVAIYDDADFYQLLLKELVDQRTVESASTSQMVTHDGAAAVIATQGVKQRKLVNRKASKGRVMRFMVHDKLLSFMAPEDRRAWEQAAIDRFFGTLFGRKMELDEDVGDEDEDMAEEVSLRLFRS